MTDRHIDICRLVRQKRGNNMNELNLIAVLRAAADEIEKIRARNLELDREIARLKYQYRVDIDAYAQTRTKHEAAVSKSLESAPTTRAFKVMMPPPNAPITDVAGVSKRALRALGKVRVVYVKDLQNVTLARLARIDKCGRTTINEIKGLASRCGITLK